MTKSLGVSAFAALIAASPFMSEFLWLVTVWAMMAGIAVYTTYLLLADDASEEPEGDQVKRQCELEGYVRDFNAEDGK